MTHEVAVEHPERKETVSVWVKLWLAFHIIAITSWALPDVARTLSKENREPHGSENILLWNEKYVQPSPVRPYLIYTSLWQRWDMFAPNPANTDFYLTANITYKNGVVREYKFRRIFEMNYWDKWLNERYRKYLERGNDDQYPFLRPYLAKWIARKMDKDPGNPPLRVALIRHWQSIAPPGQPPNDTYKQYQFAVVNILPEDLKP